MCDDLPERLREFGFVFQGRVVKPPIAKEAADEIERLQSELEQLRGIEQTLRYAFAWLENLALTAPITITFTDDGELQIQSGIHVIHKHIDLKDLCVEQVTVYSTREAAELGGEA